MGILSLQIGGLSVLRRCLLAFFALNAALSFIFGWMMDTTSLSVFCIPAVERGWDMKVKALACRRAAAWCIFSFALVVLAPLRVCICSSCRVVYSLLRLHIHRRCSNVVSRERRNLLGCKDSDGEEEEMIGF
ncbi:hypothetical protein TRVL_01044 [Trypanosoma vivax]|uniref:Uncharacterized protein n=1 Tax=Trypanosoma vivax (strain Y486) TaxID=1055687 RepID=G0TU95_TRYVY|nr:hypothetical protein TRVL_01044 [Trypanosoma vivax]CCC47529.1 conserved hypothetical protein, unlikely [Trypanosoma vivax Y486]